MYKLFDFQCSECKKVEEHFIDTNETISIPCTTCTRDKTVTMDRLISAPKGYVKDTINPVRYTRNYHAGWFKENDPFQAGSGGTVNPVHPLD